MTDKDKEIQALRREAAKWRSRAIEAAAEACKYCEDADPKGEDTCQKCRIRRIQEEAK